MAPPSFESTSRSSLVCPKPAHAKYNLKLHCGNDDGRHGFGEDDVSFYPNFSSSSTPRQVHFRAELEFLVQTSSDPMAAAQDPDLVDPPREAYVDKSSQRRSVQNCIAERLREVGIFSIPDSVGEKTGEMMSSYEAFLTTQKQKQKQKQDSDTSWESFFDGGHWTVEVDERETVLPDEPLERHYNSYIKAWRLVRIRSPLMAFSKENLGKLNFVLDSLRETPDLVIALDHVPRLRVQVKPQVGEFTLGDVKRIATLLWAASPRVDKLHAKYCGPGSPVSPGLDFARVFNPLPVVYLTDAYWATDGEETVFTHGPPVQSKTPMLRTPGVARNSASSELAAYDIAAAEELKDLVAMLCVRAKDEGAEAFDLAGAYDFSRIKGVDAAERTIQFAQHAGTMDVAAVENWIKVCNGLVIFCLNATEEQLERVHEKLASPFRGHGARDPSQHLSEEEEEEETYNVYDFLVDIDLPSQAAYYKSLGPNPFVPDLARRRRTKLVNLDETEGLSPLTFGIELEFLVPYARIRPSNSDADVDPSPSDPRWFLQHKDSGNNEEDTGETIHIDLTSGRTFDKHAEHITKILNEAGHLSSTVETIFDAVRAFPENPHEGLVAAAEETAGLLFFVENRADPGHQTWCVQTDSSLSSFDKGALGYSGGVVGIEISSPILRDTAADFGRLVDVVALLRSNTRPMVDITCGLHVHVGTVRNFSLRSLKRAATLLWVLDPIIYTLVHPSRQAGTYSQPLRTTSVLAVDDSLAPYEVVRGVRRDDLLAAEIEAHVPMDALPDRLKREFYRIWAARKEEAVKELFNHKFGCRSGVSLQRIRREWQPASANDDNEDNDPAAPVLGGTIEFRCFEGTLDPEMIVHWVKLLLAVMGKAEAATPREFHQIMSRILGVGDGDGEDHKENDDGEEEKEGKRLAAALDALGMGHALGFWAGLAARQKALDASSAGYDGNEPENIRWGIPRREMLCGEEPFEVEKVRRWLQENLVMFPEVSDDEARRSRRVFS